MPTPDALPTVLLQGVLLHAVTEEQAVQHVLRSLAAGQGGRVVTPNVDILRRARRSPGRELLRTADLVLADGMPLVWASRLQRTPLPARVPGSSLIWSLSAAAESGGHSVFVTGGLGEVSRRAADRLSARYPGLGAVGHFAPPPALAVPSRALDELVSAVTDSRPDIVFVGLGFPKQDQVAEILCSALPSAWLVGCGAAVDFAAGSMRQAPVRLQKSGLEWAYRLLQEPQRLGRRYLVDGPPAAAGLLWGALRARWASGRT